MLWPVIKKEIVKTLEFADFKEAVDFIDKIAPLCEKANHHPDILLHDYRKITISMHTHTKNSITQKDHDLAREIDLVYENKFK
jgi:4a-hydroxytetrahydrobiopterin dehydratase